jgi:hypothetical protein
VVSNVPQNSTGYDVQSINGRGKVLKDGRLVCEVEYDLAVSHAFNDSGISRQSTVRGFLFTGGTILPFGVQHDLEIQDGRMVGFVSAGIHFRFSGDLR